MGPQGSRGVFSRRNASFWTRHRVVRTFFAYLISLLLVFPPWIISPAVAAYLDRTSTHFPADTSLSYDIASVDIDQDNDFDLVVANAGQSRLLVNDGTGHFSDESATRLPILDLPVIAVSTGDLDGDSDSDLLLVGIGVSRILINDGTGHYLDDSAGRLPDNPHRSMDAVVGDLDDDGDLDILLANHRSRNQVLINNGSGVFTDQSEARLPADEARSMGVVLSDLDANGTLDLLVLNQRGEDRFWLNNGLGVFSEAAGAIPALNGESLAAVSADPDGDGDQDLLVARGANGLQLLQNDGNGQFTDVTATLLPSLSDYVIRVLATDIDADGDADIFLANAGQDRLLLNDGTGRFDDATPSQLPVDPQRSFGTTAFDAEADFDPDIALATLSGQNRYLDNEILIPRVRLSASPDYIEVGDSVTISVDAFDEDGIKQSTLTITAPDGGTTDFVGLGDHAFVPALAGEYSVLASVSDNLDNIGTRNLAFEVLSADTTPPTVILTSDPDTALQGTAVAIHVEASDDRAVTDISLTVDGVPFPLDINGDATYSTIEVGDHNLVATARDQADNEGTDTGSVTILPDMVVPTVSVTVIPDPVDLRNPVAVTVTTDDNVAVVSRTAQVSGPDAPGGVALVLDESGQASYTPYQPGSYTVDAGATDPAGNTGTGSSTFEAVGVADITPPVVTLDIDPRIVVIGDPTTITVMASDDTGVTETSLEVNGTPVALGPTGTAVYTPPVLGDYTVVARAWDATGNEGSASDNLRAADPAADTDPPVVVITSPAEEDDVSGRVAVHGSVNDATLVSYRLEYAASESGFVEFASGDAEVTDGVLGYLDASLLMNDFYVIRLTAEDMNGRTSVTEIVINVSGALKLGNFQVSFQDKAIKAGNFPITATRSYDSRQRHRKGDFGYGWQLLLRDVELVENRSPSIEWEEEAHGGTFTTYTLVPTRPHTVSLKFGEEEELQFRAQPQPSSQVAVPITWLTSMDYQPVGEAKGTLEPSEEPVFYDSGYIYDFAGAPYNPPSFTYQGDDGFSYRFTETSTDGLRHRLSRVTEPNGATITLSSTGFERSDGLGISFVRDGEGRITRLEDPNGNTLLYEYNATGDLSDMIDGEGNRTEFSYDDDHRLTEIRDPLGRPVQRQEYDEDGRVIALTDADGNSIEMEYDLDASTQIIRDRRGNPTLYEYDNRGNVTRQIEFPDVDGSQQQIETLRAYDGEDQLISETAPSGAVTNYTYTSRGELETKVRDAGGLDLTNTFTHDSAGRVLTHTDPRGNLATYAYDADGHLLSEIDRNGSATLHEYNAQGRETRTTDANGDYTAYGHDAFGNVAWEQRYAADGTLLRRMEYTYDANGNNLTESVLVTQGATTVTATTRHIYDGNDMLVETIDPAGNTTRFEYNGAGKTTAEIDPLGNRTGYSYDNMSQVIRIDYADGTSSSFTYDVDGNRTSATDRNGNTTFTEYDALNNKVGSLLPSGEQRLSRYDETGSLIGQIDERGSRTDYEYDALQRRTRTLQPEVYDAVRAANIRPETRYEYDANGNRVALVDANGNLTEYQYDPGGRKLQTLFPDGLTEILSYDGVGNKISKTDPAGLTTHSAYDALGRLVSVTLPPPETGEPAPVTRYQYGEAGNLIAQTDANGRVTRFECDLAGNKTARELPGGQREIFGYDAAGHKISHVDFASVVTGFGYDSVGQQTGVTYANGSAVETEYGGEGQRLRVTDSRGDTVFTYDERGKLLNVTHPDGAVVRNLYDAVGNRVSVDSPAGVVRYGYDALNRLTSVIDSDGGLTEYGYDAVGSLVDLIYANGTSTRYTYNARNQLTRLATSTSGGSILQSFDYLLNANGLREQITESDSSQVIYTYDDNYRLTREQRTGSNPYEIIYAYDAVGNRIDMQRDGVATAYAYDINDRLQSAGAETYGYDASGNQTSKTEGADLTTYEYNSANRLIRSVNTTGGVTEYGYDADGSRVAMTDASGETHYLLDAQGPGGMAHVLEELSGAGALQVHYTYGHDLLAQERSGIRSYYHYDGLGSTRALSDASEAVTDTYLYDAYGRQLAATGATPNSYLFAGERYDPNIGLYHLRARYYDQRTGRFISMDPHQGDLQTPASLHRYLYAYDNPVNFIDPTGEMTMIEMMIVVSIQGGLRTAYLKNVVKMFFTAARIALCSMYPARKMREMGMDMMNRGIPGGAQLMQTGTKIMHAGIQRIGRAIIQTYRNMANDVLKLKIEFNLTITRYVEAKGGSSGADYSRLKKIASFGKEVYDWIGKLHTAFKTVSIEPNVKNPCQSWMGFAGVAEKILDKVIGWL